MSSPDPGAALTLEEARALAQQHGLSSLAARPGLGRYLRQLWER